ncbi:MAG: AbrB/MazE/SpoVT family DNA-binding domain-containing protein [Rhodospirillaceae bacterium]|nr:AbrB/MazE/SpoVT family DNA-binding domain-containing protein [Rhodospirillaceae bacterium]
MVVSLKLRAIGNSVGVVLPKDVLSRLRVQKGDTIYLTEAQDGFRITVGDPDFERQMQIAEGIMNKYRNALRELAK